MNEIFEGMGNVYRVEYNKEEDGFVDLSSGDIFVPKKTLSDSSLLEESSSDDLFLVCFLYLYLR